jgi:DNA-binding winged helix-turn-helix (wHTH) protein
MRNIKINIESIIKDIKQRLLEKQNENYSIHSKLEVMVNGNSDTNSKYYWLHTLFDKDNKIIENQKLLDIFLKNRSSKNKNIEVILPTIPKDLQEKFNQIL